MTRDFSSALHTDTPCGQSQILGMLYGGQTGVWLYSKECCCTLARALWAPTGAPARLGHLLQFYIWFSTFLCPGKEVPWLASTACCRAGLACPNHILTALQPLIRSQLLFL